MADNAGKPNSRLIAIVLAAVLGMASGFQLARWTAPEAASGANADTVPAHDHPAQAAPAADVGGLSVSVGGYTLAPEQTNFPSGAPSVLRFRVIGPGGAPVTTYATVLEKQLHLVLARRDLGGYQHLHPTMSPDGVWSTPLTLAGPGVWRAFADFSVLAPNGSQIPRTLGVDLTVAGNYAPVPLPAQAREHTVNGYVVTYEGSPRAAATVPLVFRVFRGGAPISALEPYLGSLGHLVVLREGDLGYVHVHADPPASSGEIRFWLTTPNAGRYRMFLDFKVGGGVQTAEFTVQVP